MELQLNEQKSSSTRIMLTITIMTATVMQVLDTTIANVALPHMQGTLSATQDQITWVLTSYILSSAIMMTLTSILSDRLGRKRLFIISICGFTISSMLCGIADSLNSMVLYRFLQGIFGASFVPLSQSIILDIYPKEKHGSALALWGMGIMVGPILGPIIGGYLTDEYNWRWVFYVNVPVGIAAFIGIMIYLKETPINKTKLFDLKGFLLLSLFLSSLQIALDRGEQLDWFTSLEIQIEFMVAFFSLYFFIVHSCVAKNPFISLNLFKDKNFVFCLILGFIIGANLQSTLSLMPSLLQDLMNYPVLTAGYMMAPRGVGTMIAMIMVGRLIGKVDTRLLIFIGLMATAYSLLDMTAYSPLMDYWPIITSGIILGFGLGFIFVPLTSAAFSTLSTSQRSEAAGIYNLVRNIGGSIGISFMESFATHNIQVNHAHLTEYINPYNKNLSLYSLDLSKTNILAQWDGEIIHQATFWSYINSFKILMFSALFCMIFLIFLKKSESAAVKSIPAD